MIKVKPEKLNQLVPRMLELTSRRTPWHRRDWRAGTLELVEETLSESRIPGIRDGALKELQGHMAKALGRDPGVSRNQKTLIEHARKISPSSSDDSYDGCSAAHYVEELKNTYLQNWAELFDSPDEAGKLDVEGTAKRIISHLLYCGVPGPSVYKIISDMEKDAEEYEFSYLLRELDKRTKYSSHEFSFAVLVNRIPDFMHSQEPGKWLTPKQMKQWKHENTPHATAMRHYGGFILSVDARDVNEAAVKAQRQLSQLSFKFQAGSDNRFSILSTMWSKEKGTDFPTRRAAQPLKLRAFQRADTLHDLDIPEKTRNILAIIEPLQTQDPHVAIVNGWVAIESLLVGSEDDDRTGAERLALVVAASYFRTEMTWLARNYSKAYKNKSPLAKQIENARFSLDRAKLLSQAMSAGENFDLLS